MARRYLIAFVTLIMLWTGTLLHDLFEDDGGDGHHHIANWQQPGSLVAGLDLPIVADVDSPEHFHGPVLLSKFDNSRFEIQYKNHCFPALVIGHWTNRSDVLTFANLQRPPPDVGKKPLQVRLYLLNRALLI